jgi:adenosylcobinamide kinase / adenosylcobinamide-phosphate guanylyltransferase
MSLVVLIGGARSGKSRLAVRLGDTQGARVVFIATAEARDAEMADRIARHRADRPAEWTTVEEPLRLEAALEAAPDEACVIVDCLSLWVANLGERSTADEIVFQAAAAADVAARRPGLTIAVTNEVGLGVVPGTPLGRSYRDVLGSVNSAWAERAARTFFVVAGQVQSLRRPESLLELDD